MSSLVKTVFELQDLDLTKAPVMQLTEYLYLSTYPKFALFEKTKTKKKKHDFTFFI